jgi:hypothetical protein
MSFDGKPPNKKYVCVDGGRRGYVAGGGIYAAYMSLCMWHVAATASIVGYPE